MLTSRAVTAAVAATTSTNRATSRERPGGAKLLLLLPRQWRAESTSLTMTDTRVAADARQVAGVRQAGNGGLMAVQTRRLKNVRILRGDADRFRKVLQGERKRVMPAILGLGDVLADEPVRQMTVHASCRGVMARRPPRVELRPHDVTVDARGRVTAQVRESLGVPEGESTHADKDGQRDQGGRDQPVPARSSGGLLPGAGHVSTSYRVTARVST